MDENLILLLGQEALKTTALVASPMLIGALVIGLVISVLQAVTQINESTLTFIPKMAVVAVIIVVAAPWMIDIMSTYTIELFENITTFVRE